MNGSFYSKVKKGFLWLFLNYGILKILTAVWTIILARILSPSDFGVFGLASVIVNLMLEINSGGIKSFIIYNRENTEKATNAAFSLHLILAVFFSIVTIIFSGFFSHFYKQPFVKNLLIVMAFIYIINVFRAIPQSVLMREMKFNTIAQANIIGTLIAVSLSVFSAFLNYKVWSLAVFMLAEGLFVSIFLLILGKWRPSFYVNIDLWNKVFKYAKNIIAAGILWYLIYYSDRFFIGKFLGERILGLYTLAVNQALFPVFSIGYIANQLAFPSMSELQNNKEELKYFINNSIKIISGIGFLIYLVLFVFSSEFIIGIFGAKWSEAVLPFKILIIYGIIRLLFSPVESGMRAIGIPSVELKVALILCPVALIGFFIGANLSFIMMLFAVLLTVACPILVIIYIYCKKLNVEISELLKNIFPFFVVSIFTFTLLYIIKVKVLSGFPCLLSLFAGGISGLCFYIILLQLIFPQTLMEIKKWKTYQTK